MTSGFKSSPPYGAPTAADAEALPTNDARERFTLDAAQIGTWEWDLATGRVYWYWSDRIACLHGMEPDAFEGTFEAFIARVHPEDRTRVRHAIDEAVERDAELWIEYRAQREDGSIHWMEGRGRCVSDRAGRPQRMRGICMDITQRKRAEQWLRALVDVGATLAGSLDYETTLTNVTRLVVPEWADWCAIDLVEEPGHIRGVALDHTDPAKVHAVREMRRRYSPQLGDPYGAGYVIRTGNPQLVEHVTDEVLERVAKDVTHLQLLRELGLRSGVVVPLVSHGRTLGALTLVSAESAYRFRKADLPHIQDLASRCAVAVDNARRHEQTQEALRRQRQAQRQVEARARQQQAVAMLGRRALSEPQVQSLLDHAVRVVAEALDTEMCKVLELLPGGEEMRLRAGVGWREGLVGTATVGTGHDSQAGHTLTCEEAVIVEDLHQETRFNGPALLRDHGVISGMSVIIGGEGRRPWGVLGTHSTRYRRFTQDDTHFLESVANVLAEALRRQAAEHRLRQLNETLEQRVAERAAEAHHRARQLQWMNAELSRIEQRERRKLAEILHDHHQQLLVAAKLQTEMLARVNADELSGKLEHITQMLQEAIDSSRSLSHELSPSMLFTHGFGNALRWLAEEQRETYGLRLHVDAADDAEPTHDDVREQLFQCVRELLLNIVKHAETDEAWICAAREGQDIVLTVEDRGRGFDARALGDDEEHVSLGLFALRERLALIGGETRIDTAPGTGTRVTLRLGLDAAADPHGAERSTPPRE